MRFSATLFAAVLAAGVFAGAAAVPCRAGVSTEAVPSAAAQAPQPADGSDGAPVRGTQQEERNYAQLEAASPKAQEFTGGWLLELLIIVALVVIILLLV